MTVYLSMHGTEAREGGNKHRKNIYKTVLSARAGVVQEGINPTPAGE